MNSYRYIRRYIPALTVAVLLLVATPCGEKIPTSEYRVKLATLEAGETQAPSEQAINILQPTPESPDKPEGLFTHFDDGTWRIGIDIVAGTYRTDETDACFWYRISDFSGSTDSWIEQEILHRGPAVVTIAPTDIGFKSQHCGTWVLVD